MAQGQEVSCKQVSELSIKPMPCLGSAEHCTHGTSHTLSFPYKLRLVEEYKAYDGHHKRDCQERYWAAHTEPRK